MKIKVRIYRLKNVKISANLQRFIELNYSDNLDNISEEVIICCYNAVVWDIISKSASVKLVIIDGTNSCNLPKINKTIIAINDFFKNAKIIKNKNLLKNLIVSFYIKKYLYKKTKQDFKVYILRHGETSWNKKKIYQGKLNSQLTEKGLITAQKMAKYLKSVNMKILFSSPQKRSIKTSELIAKYTNTKIIIVNQFREMDLGIFEGKKIVWVKKIFRKYFELRESNKKAKVETPYPCGESYRDVYLRVFPMLLKIACDYDNFIIVGHEGVNRLIRGILQDMQLTESVYMKQSNDEVLFVNIAQNNEQIIKIN